MAAPIQHCVSLGGFNRASTNGNSRFAGGWTVRKRFVWPPFGAFQGESGLHAASAIEDVKLALRSSLTGINRGIFGVQTPKKVEIEALIRNLESMNPCHKPTENLEKLEGDWQLLYSTISILGSKRTKLGLRDFISFGQFLQRIDVKQSKAVNVIGFSVPALSMLKGSLTISASYNISSPTRVNIEYESSTIVPAQLMSLFQKNYDLLLNIFNPAGWLEITYVDESWRIGRDDKGNIFLVEKVEQLNNSSA